MHQLPSFYTAWGPAMARRCFYSLNYLADAQRTARIRSLGPFDGDRPAPDTDWDPVASNSDEAIQRWIDWQLEGKACTVVLVGEHTAGRKWVNYEIERCWAKGMGVVGIRIHGLGDSSDRLTPMGDNPFDHVTTENGRLLSSMVRCYTPPGATSTARFAWITEHLPDAVQQAIRIRNDA